MIVTALEETNGGHELRRGTVPELKIGLQLTALRMPFRKAIAAAQQMGVSAIEIDAREQINVREMTDTALRQLKKMLEDANLRVCALSFRTRNGYNVVDRIQERMDATKAAMDLAYKLGASVVVNQIGRIPEEEGEEWDTMVDVLTEIGKHAQRCGAFLAAETGSEEVATMKNFISALPEGMLGITLNPGNLIVNGFSATEATQELGQHIMYVRAKDGVRDLAQGRGLEVPLGRGSVDFPQLIGTLEEHGYRGYFAVARDNAQGGPNELSMAVQYLRNI